MTIRPRLNIICGRCGRPREGLRHVCRSNSAKRATIKLAPVLGGCARCGKQYGGRNGNPLTHVCNPRKGDFRGRRAAQRRTGASRVRASRREAEREKQRQRIAAVRKRERERSRAQFERLKARYQARIDAERAKARAPHQSPAKPASKPKRPPHDYRACADEDCQRPICVAFKEGYKQGHEDGYHEGYEQGYSIGFDDGIAACPRKHTM